MADIQKQFEEFHDVIKLKRFGENATLREKRDVIKNKVTNGLRNMFEDNDNEVPAFEYINQGSYAVDLGIIPDDGNFDIDVGVIFDLYIQDYDDPIKIKKWIKEIMDDHTSIPTKIKNPCITITYSLDGEPSYHVDLPIYLKSKYNEELYLGFGKVNSNNSDKYWEIADPKGLNDYINSKFEGEDKRQFKRIVRYLKKWKDVRFNKCGKTSPPSVGITIAVCEMFHPYTEYNALKGKVEYLDLKALKAFISLLMNKFIAEWDMEKERYYHSIAVYLPVEPYKNIFEKMTKNQMTVFYNELIDLYDALESAEADSDPHTACELVANYFGENFPIPEASESRYVVGKSNSPSSTSAKRNDLVNG